MSSTAWLIRSATPGAWASRPAPCSDKSDGEQSLDHQIVKIAGDPITIGEQGELGDLLVEAGVLDGDARGHREGDHQFLVDVGEHPADLLVGEVQVPEDACREPGSARRGRSASAGGSAGTRTSPDVPLRSGSRSGSGSVISRPRRPWPSGSAPMRRRCSSSMPTVRNWSRRVPVGSSTPSAPYRASASSVAASSTRCRRAGNDSSDPMDTTASNRRRSC